MPAGKTGKRAEDLGRKRQMDRILEKPWEKAYYNMCQRCNNKNNTSYFKYGGRGIKCLITKEELKKLWFRDKGYLLKVPSLDRINGLKNYEFDNCRFIEKNINSSMKRTNKINFKIAQKIREDIKHGKSYKDISKQYGITTGFVCQIKCNKWYKPELHDAKD